MRADNKPGTPAVDALWCDVPMPLERIFHPLGFPVHLKTNSRLVIEAANESWRKPLTPTSAFAPVCVCLGVSDSESGMALPPVFRARDHLLSIISDPQNFVIADMRSGYAFGWVSEHTARDRSFLRYYFLEACAMTLIEQLYLAPVHAAAVARNDIGVLLYGDTGAGKSTLAYACARSGWTYVSDDASYIVRGDSQPRVIGNCRSLRLRADAADLFCELLPFTALARANGKIGFELATDSLPEPIQVQDEAVITDLVILHRDAAFRSAADLEPVKPRDPARVYRSVWCGDAHVRDAQRRSYEQLTGARWWTLRYADFSVAVAMLNQLHSAEVGRGMP